MRAPFIAIPKASYTQESVDGDSITTHYGRLLIDGSGLYFIHGWEETRDVRNASFGGTIGGLAGALVVAAADAGNSEHAMGEGMRMLAEVASLSPAEQVERIHGSVFVPIDDIEQASTSWLASKLSITTARLGERYELRVPREQISAIREWLKTRPRS
jgi:hypothetical protein